MTNAFGLPRKLIILAIVLPLAAIAGYLLASPTDVDSVAFVGLLLLVLATPLFLRWHHPMFQMIQITISGHDGEDAHRYQENEVAEALERLRERQRSSP